MLLSEDDKYERNNKTKRHTVTHALNHKQKRKLFSNKLERIK